MKIRHLLTAYLVAMAIIAISIGIANAEDKILDTKIDSATVAVDKNGAEYVRFIITEPRSLNGVEYNKSLPVMAFGEHVTTAKAYKAGDAIKAVANYRKLPDGRESYTILSFVQ